MRRRVRVVAIALVLVGACGDSDDDAGDAGAVEAMVLETCAPGRTPVEEQVCRCAYRELAQRYDAEEIEDLDRQLRDDPETVPADVQEVVLACGFEVVSPPTTAPTTAPTTSTSTSTTRPRSTSTSTSTPTPTSATTSTSRRP